MNSLEFEYQFLFHALFYIYQIFPSIKKLIFKININLKLIINLNILKTNLKNLIIYLLYIIKIERYL